ncbi:MAG: N-acetyltransferase [Candidatus Odinarchaeota archaeon]|nr:N-acetyltransferase [Candidatus Odinarchaeota archaeon]
MNERGEKLEIIHHKKSQRFFIKLGPGKASYLKYNVQGNVMNIDATYTPEEFRGRGLAGRLMEEAIKFARENRYKIKPNCSYAVYYFKKHPEHKDLLVEEIE